ncbi:MAG: hypothetical protein NTX79_05475 [Candidatus Micrarchaeota archaeon]|nr:hypothetical protein [Candidatus Micrarchaeota archaeon]
MNGTEIISFVQTYKEAILIIAGFFGFILYLFGKVINDEWSFYSNAKENDYVTGLGFFTRIFYVPAVIILLLRFLFHLLQLPPQLGASDSQVLAALFVFLYGNWLLILDLFMLFILSNVLLQMTQKELKRHAERLDFFEKHEEYAKNNLKNNNQIQVWSYWWAPLAFILFALLCYAHTLAPFGIFDAVSIAANGIIMLFILLATAIIHGQCQQKPKIFIYTDFQKKPFEAFFIRWENDCIRVVPRDASSRIIPKSRILRIDYPKREVEPPKEQIGFMAKVTRVRACIKKCLSEIR